MSSNSLGTISLRSKKIHIFYWPHELGGLVCHHSLLPGPHYWWSTGKMTSTSPHQTQTTHEPHSQDKNIKPSSSTRIAIVKKTFSSSFLFSFGVCRITSPLKQRVQASTLLLTLYFSSMEQNKGIFSYLLK